jgi:hypothetical protein
VDAAILIRRRRDPRPRRAAATLAVLAAQSVFLPADAGASPAQQRQLDAVVREAAGRGFPIRVAVISSPSDLGSVSALWHRPNPTPGSSARSCR